MSVEVAPHPLKGKSLYDVIADVSPQFKSPFHLHDWITLIERAVTEAVRGLCAIPIRHHKSETTMHGIVKLLVEDPSRRIIFLTYSGEAAIKRGKRIRQLATAAGVGPARGFDLIADWQNDRGGGVVCMAAAQSKLGLDCHALICDDPIDEFGAEDPKIRDAVDEAITHYTARCMRNGEPGPVLILMSRWHPDDPIGRRIHRTAREWIYVHAPAIIDLDLPTERAFAPEVWSLKELKAVREELKETDPTERIFWAQLQNEPRPMGADLFGEAHLYNALPDGPFRRGYGVDMAYTIGEGSDWFARVAARVYARKLYLLDVTRHKIDAHLIESTCKADTQRWGRAPFFSYMSGPEVGMASVLRERGVWIVKMHARYNKLVRAQRSIKRWNDGDILVPADPAALWVPGFLHRVSYFRGREKDSDDDEIDALVSLADGMLGGAVAGQKPKTLSMGTYRGMN